MANHRVQADSERGRGPGRQSGGSFKLVWCRGLIVELTLTTDQKMTGRVVVGIGVADRPNRTTFIDVPIAINDVVIRKVWPTLIGLVVSLVVAHALRRILIVLKKRTAVMNRHAGDLVFHERAHHRAGSPSGLRDHRKLARRDWLREQHRARRRGAIRFRYLKAGLPERDGGGHLLTAKPFQTHAGRSQPQHNFQESSTTNHRQERLGHGVSITTPTRIPHPSSLRLHRPSS